MLDLDSFDVVVSAELKALTKKADWYERRSRAQNSTRCYGTAWKNYTDWCGRYGFGVVPGDVEVLKMYIAVLAKRYKASTVSTYVSGIRYHYRRLCGDENIAMHSCITRMVDGVMRELLLRPDGADALRVEHVRKLVSVVDKNGGGRLTARGRRDRALVLLMYAGAFRRSEVAGLDWQDLKRKDWGYLVELRKSKTDQWGRGQEVGIHKGQYKETCPVRALNSWRKCGDGGVSIFRGVDKHRKLQKRLTGDSINRVIKELVEKAELKGGRFSSHSLRAGFITDMVSAGHTSPMIQKQSRHSSEAMVNRYFRPGLAGATNYTEMVGL